jgi:hypothetical protein
MMPQEPRLTTRPCLNKKPDEDGFHLVLVRLTKGRRTAYLETRMEVMENDWNAEATLSNAIWVGENMEEFKDMNDLIVERCLMAHYLEEIDPEIDVEGICDMLRDPKYGMFVELSARAHVARSRATIPNRSLEDEIQRLGQRVTHIERIAKKSNAPNALQETH